MREDEAHRTSAEKARCIDEGGVDRGETGDQRLHGKGQAVDDRADDQAIEGEGEGMAEEGGDAAADGGAGAEEDEKKEAEHGGRQDHGQRGQGFKRGEPAAAAEHEQRRERHGDGEEDRRGDRGQPERECERLPVHGFHRFRIQALRFLTFPILASKNQERGADPPAPINFASF